MGESDEGDLEDEGRINKLIDGIVKGPGVRKLLSEIARSNLSPEERKCLLKEWVGEFTKSLKNLKNLIDGVGHA